MHRLTSSAIDASTAQQSADRRFHVINLLVKRRKFFNPKEIFIATVMLNRIKGTHSEYDCY
jgi:hypothetical protein